MNIEKPVKSKFNFRNTRQGKLLIQEPVRIDKKVKWKCLCDCGNTVFILTGNLNNGQKSCGCISKPNLINQKFSRLTVLQFAKKETKNRGQHYLCRCECGREIIVRSDALTSGHTKSCGCIRKTTTKKTAEEKIETLIDRYYKEYINNAQQRSLNFDISKNNFKKIIFSACYYCGDEPFRVYSLPYIDTSIKVNGLDRKNPAEAYYLKNIVPCCWPCNDFKGSDNKKEFLAWVASVYNKIL
jgi:hypothetical protein